MVEVKICGVTSLVDALRCVELGADAIGLNFWPSSPRSTDVETAAEIVQSLAADAQIVGVFVDFGLEQIRAILRKTGIEWAQLHGDEPPELVSRLLPTAYKAIGVKDKSTVEIARRYPGDHVLLDASIPGLPGGTGRTFDWAVAAEVAEERILTLAGGLTPDNVVEAVRKVRPFRVDVASGVELAPGRKDLERVLRFIEAAKSA